MSVVNQMLKDLEQQQADKRLQFDEADLEVIAADGSARSGFTLKFIFPVVLIVIGVASWFLLGDTFSLSAKNEEHGEVTSENGSYTSNNNASSEESAAALQPDVVLPKQEQVSQKSVSSEKIVPINKRNQSNIVSNASAIEVKNTVTEAKAEDSDLNKNAAIETTTAGTVSDSTYKVNENLTSTKRVTERVESTSQPVSTRGVVKEISQAQQKSVRLEQARQWISLGDFARAEQQLLALLADFNDFHAAREQLAYVYLQTQKTGALEALLKNALESFPQHTTYRVLLARQYADAKDWNAVVALTLSHVVNDERLLLMRALAFQQLKQHENAVEVYVELLRQQSTRGDWWIGFAVSLEALERFKDAYQALNRAAQDPRLTQQQKQYIETKQRTLKGLF